MDDSKIILDFIGHTDFAAAVRESYHCPGAVKLASYFDYFRQQNPQGTILLDAGDVLVGAPIINLTQGEPVMEVVNLFGYDAMTLGNHEFDPGWEVMQKILPLAAFPLLCANVIKKETGCLLPFVQPYIMLDRQGVKIGVLGVTTEYTPYMVKEESFSPFAVLDVIDTCRQYIPLMLQEGADIIVVLGHLPGTVNEDGSYSGELFTVAEQVEGIDILFGGHNPGDIALTYNGTMISKTGFSAISIGHIQIAFDRSSRQIECLKNEIVPVLQGTLQTNENPVVEKSVMRAIEPFIPILDEVIGFAEDDLVVSREGEFSLGNFFTDCMKEVCGAQIGLMNSTSCFGYIPKGPITSEMIMWVMCFNDHLYKGYMTGKQIRDMIELTYEEKHISLNGYLQISGIKTVVDTNRAAFKRVASLNLEDGSPVREDEKYLVATSAYIASGGNEYRAITSLTEWEKTNHMSHPVFIEKLKEKKNLSPRLEGRIIDLAKKCLSH